MNEDLTLLTGMFDLKNSRGLSALSAADLEDIGVTKRDGRYYDREGKLVVELEETSALRNLLQYLAVPFVPKVARTA
jgi:hypothetical protein